MLGGAGEAGEAGASTEFRIQHSEFNIHLNIGYWILDIGYWMFYCPNIPLITDANAKPE